MAKTPDNTDSVNDAFLARGGGEHMEKDTAKLERSEEYRSPKVHSYSSKELLEVLGPAQGYGNSFGGGGTNPNPF